MARWDDKEIEQRAKAAEQIRNAIMPSYREALEYTMPWRLDRRRTRSEFSHLFDSTGLTGLQRFANRVQRDFSPPFQRWFELEAGPLVPPDQAEAVNRETMVATSVAHAVLDRSSFPTASVESYADLGIGTAALFGGEGDDQTLINWKAASAWKLALEEGPGGRCDNVYFREKYPAWLLPRHWPKAEWPQSIKDKISQHPTELIEVMQATYYDPELRGWRLCVQACEAGKGHYAAYENDRDRTNPWIITRYWTTPGDPWGRGPALLAMPDIKTANKTVEMILKAAAFQLAPPLMVQHDGVLNPDTLRLAPNSLIQVSRTGGPMGPTMAPLDIGSRIDTAQLVLEDLRTNIKRHLLDSQLPPLTGAVRSASEIVGRTKELAYDTGAAYGRLNHENAPQVVARVLDILDRKKVPFMNWDRLQIDDLILRVKVTSPIARAQNLEDVETTVQFWELAQQIGGKAAFLQVANTEDGLPKLAKLMGVPLWAVNTAERRAQLADAAGQMAETVMQQGAQEPGGAAQGVQTLLGAAAA